MIRLQFSAEAGFAAEAVKLYQRGWPSHVDALLPDGTLLGARLENGVAVRAYGYAKFTRVAVIELPQPLGADREATFLAFLKRQLGKPYDMKAIVAFTVERDWRDERAWFCSELIARALEVSRFFPKDLSVGVNEVTPRDLMMAVSPWRTNA
jgi:hypothetical protein